VNTIFASLSTFESPTVAKIRSSVADCSCPSLVCGGNGDGGCAVVADCCCIA